MKTRILQFGISALALLPGVAFGQKDAANDATLTGQIADIVVTAQRRETRLQDTPISITAVSGQALAERAVTNLIDITRFTPNLVSSSGTVSSNDGNYFIRGIGQQDAFSNVEPGVGVYLDGVYLGRTAGAALDLADIDRVEVLRGPQGTLFGRNTIGGAVNLTTTKPADSFGGHGVLRVGERSRIDAGLSIDLPVAADLLTTKFSFITKNIHGPVRNVGPAGGRAGDDRLLAGRGAFHFTPASNLTIDTTVDVTRRRGTAQCSFTAGFNTASAGIPADANSRVSPDRNLCYSSVVDNDARLDTWGVATTAALDLGMATLKSITAYRKLRQYAPVDNDGSDYDLYDLITRKRQSQFSEEIQAYGKGFGDRLSWLVGGYYFQEDIHERQRLTFAVAGPNYFRYRDFKPETKSYAVFGQATLSLTEQLSVTGGLRWTRDDKTMDVFNQDQRAGVFTTVVDTLAKKHWSSVTPKIGVEWKAQPNWLLYASYSEGFRGGGFNARVRAANQLISFDPEKAKVYEAGSKIDAFDRRLRFNLAGFFTDYRSIQILALQNGFFSNRNAGDAHLYGFEAELTAKPTGALTFNGGVGYTHSRYRDLLPGIGLTTASRLPYAPLWTVTIGGQYSHDIPGVGPALLRVDYSYKSSQNIFSPDSIEPGYGLVNARAAVTVHEGVELALYGRNLFDKHYAVFRSVDLSGGAGSLGISNEFQGERRELGVEVNISF
ncbi:TonB-dependent receptor [Sphingomonas sp. YL-JM2C]